MTRSLEILFLLIVTALHCCFAGPISYPTTEHGIALIDPYGQVEAETQDLSDTVPALATNVTFARLTAVAADNTTVNPIFKNNNTILGSMLKNEVNCFGQHPGISLPPAEPVDCLNLAEIMMVGSKVWAPLEWSNLPGGGANRLPHHWSHKSCRADLEAVEGEQVEEYISMGHITEVAAEIIQPCIYNDKNRLGGVSLIGDQLKIRVVVRGERSAVETS